jgi:hypothetical protein
MNVTRLSPSRKREDVRAWWSEHLQAQRHSGQTQAAYCRDRGLDAKYFTLWKRKLLDASVASERDEPPRLVPVVVRSEGAMSAATEVDTSSSAAVAIRLNLGNGMSLSLEVAAGTLGTLVRELAAVRC